MTNRYNMVINILFWVLVSVLISFAVIIVLSQNDHIDSFLVKTETEIVVEKEPVYINNVKEIGKETEWFYFVATGYSANDPLQGTNNITATGKEIKKGMIAVDSKIIPLGTRIEIKDLGVFVAEDTGGKIKGNRIDIYFETKEEAKEFGRQTIWVRVLGNSIELVEALHGLN
ncbi:MAG: 3D domain-containing protein [Actinobacteria bacterium]|nr:3D domain-containing protein [Actinomycetota bacterium]